MSNEFLVDLSSMVGKPVDELTTTFNAFRDEISDKYKGRLTGERLEQRAQGLFKQKYRAERVAIENSPAKPFILRIMGISDIKDKVEYVRKEAEELYDANPNKYVMEGRVNEYTEVDDGILKRYYDYLNKPKLNDDGDLVDKKGNIVDLETYEYVVEEMVAKVSPNATEVGENSGVWIAPVDINESNFGKTNSDYGIEYPLHKYSRYVYGVAEPQAGGDAKWAKLMLRGNTATQDMPEVNKSYVIRALSFTKDKDEEYSLLNMPKQAVFVETDWNPFAPKSFVESVMELDFIKNKTMPLGKVEDFLKGVEAQKASGEFKKWNDAILVEVDIMEMKPNLDPAKNWSDKLIVDDESLRADFDLDKIQSNITAWGSQANEIDFGTDSRVLLTCYPSRGKKEENEKIGPLRLTVFGTYAFEELKTDFNVEDFTEEDL